MGKPYASEIDQLCTTYTWAKNINLDGLTTPLRECGQNPLVVIGSGGSLTAAHVLSDLHRRLSGRVSNVSTPLEAISAPVDPAASYWLLSAGGGNVDILNAFTHLASGEPRQLGIICGTPSSPLASLAKSHAYVDLFEFDFPSGKDGFLATNSLFATSLLLSRAYIASLLNGQDVIQNLAAALDKFFSSSSIQDQWNRITQPLWDRETILVLYGVSTKAGAIDLESKFTESAIGVIQNADYRNFAHGRHHWLAKRGEKSGVLAFITPEDQALAESTLECLPPEVPVSKLFFDGIPEVASLESLLASLYLTGWAGAAKGIDPGKPGVPSFGEKLYNLSKEKITNYSRSRTRTFLEAALERKTGQTSKDLKSNGNWNFWANAFSDFVKSLESTAISAVVLDYDGTLVDTRDRFVPPKDEIVFELIRVLATGTVIGVATGRGPSVRKDLREVIPDIYWGKVFIGYYNGAEVGNLEDDRTPDNSIGTCNGLHSIYCALKEHPELKSVANFSARQYQITIQPKNWVPENRLWEITNQLVAKTNGSNLVVRSSHSVDVLHEGVSKINVLEYIRKKTERPGNILTIGDRGRWPGNDYALLQEPFSLSVDEVSPCPKTCWNLAPVGQRGVQVTLLYLKCLVKNVESSGVIFKYRGGNES